MQFRPCIDIHNGRVKQIVGGSLKDCGNAARENFVSEKPAAYYAGRYREDGLRGGHVVLLNPPSSEYYERTKEQALEALRAYPGGLQVGGGIREENAGFWLEHGASHVIVTSFVFQDGKLNMDNLKKMVREAGRERLVLDLSCRKRAGSYYIVTDRWQKFTDLTLSSRLLEELAGYCSEFLIHGVDVEGKAAGIDTELVQILAESRGLSITYAGGVGSLEDLEKLRRYGRGRIHATIGSALDLFGGSLEYKKVLELCDEFV